MNLLKKEFIFFIFFFNIGFLIFSQVESDSSIYMDFRNQKISDIIYSVADICGKSVYIDETVTGSATFHFEDKDFDSAIKRFADYCQLYVKDNDGVFVFSKVAIEIKDDKISLNTENVLIEPFLNMLSRKLEKTIMFDSLPTANVTIRVKEVSLEDVLNLVLIKLPAFSLERVADGYYITKNNFANSSKRNIDIFTLSKVENEFFLSVQKATFSTVVDALFKKAGKEYSLLTKTNLQLENLYYKNKTFEELLSLILQPGNCDFAISNGVYYIIEIQRKDILKQFKQVKVIRVENVKVEDIINLLPAEFNGSNFIKIDKNTNSIILSGSKEEINPVEKFITAIDVPCNDLQYQKFSFKSVKIDDAILLIPKNMLLSDIIKIPNANSFITLTNQENEAKLRNFVETIDNKNSSYPIKLKFIKSEELLKNLPPSVDKNCLLQSIDSTIVFFSGSEEQYKILCKELSFIDKPKQQIKYQILVIQRQKSNGFNWNTSFSGVSTDEDSEISYSALLSNVFNISFDVISQFGIQFAGSLNAELSEGKSHVLADTTLNGISGEKISFSNTNTYRYRDIIVDTKGDLYTSTTREIASGLTLSIEGWVSGDDMVTVSIDAQVSKQGSTDTSSSNSKNSYTTNPPSTSEKKVTTNVRTQSGKPIVIGGLYQQETDITEKKIPILGAIPLLGNLFKTKSSSIANTEFIIYLVPFVERSRVGDLSQEKIIERLYKKYVLQKGEKNE